MTNKQASIKYQLFILLGILLLNAPLFFDVYRTAAFNIVPHDNYAPYLLYLTGENGAVPGSPTGYRLFSVLIAIPFYYILPLFKFTYLEGQSDAYLMAVEALTFVTYLSTSLTAFLMYKISMQRFNGSFAQSILAAVITLLLFRFTAIYGIDPTAILIIAFLLYHIDRKFLFASVLFLSVGFNEKIAFFFLMLFWARFIFQKKKNYFYPVISLIAFFSYFLIRSIIDLPGHEYMVQPGMFLDKAKHTLSLLLTPKSIYLNVIPGILIFMLYYFAKAEFFIRKNESTLLFSKIDFVPILGFFVIAMVTDMQYTIGRILLFCFPLYLPLATMFLTRNFNKSKLNN